MATNLMKDKVCLIAGASQGLGRHFAYVLSAAGATVVATSLPSEMNKLDTLVAERGGIIHCRLYTDNYRRWQSDNLFQGGNKHIIFLFLNDIIL